MAFFNLFKKPDPNPGIAATIYPVLVAQARNAAFYLKRAVPDTVDGRFDLVVMHAMLIMRRLRTEGEPGMGVAQAVLDLLFADMDRSLREMGVGDMSIGKHVKKMAKAFYGRAQSYEKGMDAGTDAPLAEALQTNLYRAKPAGTGEVAGMVEYVLAADAVLKRTSFEDIRAGRIDWPTP